MSAEELGVFLLIALLGLLLVGAITWPIWRIMSRSRREREKQSVHPLTFGQGQAAANPEWSSTLSGEVDVSPAISEPDPEAERQERIGAMRKQITTWGRWLLIIGVAQFVLGGFLDPGWGGVLLVAGGMSFYYSVSPPMLSLFGLMMLWIGLSNLLSGGVGGWSLFALFQFYWAYGIFKSFLNYRNIYDSDEPVLLDGFFEGQTSRFDSDRGSTHLPILSFLAGLLGLGGGVLLILLIIAEIVGLIPDFSAWGEILESVSFYSSLFAIGIGVGAILTGYEKRGLSIAGIVMGVLRVLILLGFILLGALAG